MFLGGSGVGIAIVWLLLMVAVFWLLIVRPQRRRMVELRQLQAALQEGDEIVTTAGIFGTVTSLDDETLVVEIAPGTSVKLARGAVAQRIDPTGSDDHGTDQPDDDGPISGS